MYSISVNESLLSPTILALLNKTKMVLLNIGYKLTNNGSFVITDNLTDEDVRESGVTTINIESETFKFDILAILY